MHNSPIQAHIQRLSSAIHKAEREQDVPAQLSLYKQLAELAPRTTLVQATIAHLHLQRGEELEAAPYVQAALALPRDEQADRLLFQHLCQLPAYTAQTEQARRWFREYPTIIRFKLLHDALNRIDADKELEAVIHQLLDTQHPPLEQSQLLTLLAQLYYKMGRYHDAIGCYKLGLELTPNDRTQLFNLAATLEHVARYPEAFGYYQRVLQIDPNHAGTHNNISILMLRLGDLESGWKHHEWRWRASQLNQEHHFNIPRWQGESLEGKSLLVWAEQGIGDHIMYASLFDDLRRRGGNLHIEVYARLDQLFERSFPGVNFLRRELQGEDVIGDQKVFKQSWPKADYQIPMASLGTILRPDMASFGDGSRYLHADEQAVTRLKARYDSLFPGKRLIGLSWRGGKTVFTERQGRRIRFDDLAELAALENVQFIDLQYDSSPQDIARLQAAGLPIYHDDDVDPTSFLDPQAAQIAALDAVVSVDNTTVHLAGALGIPTYMLVQLNPNWRWGLNEGRSHWYNSVNVFRNTTLDNWKEPLARVMAALKEDNIL